MKPFASFPFGGSGKSMRTIYPFIVVPLLALLVTLGALTYYLKSRATPATAPASTTWYFDAGSVGGGFQEYLTLQNPDPSLAANVTITYLIQTNPIQTKAVQHTIPGA